MLLQIAGDCLQDQRRTLCGGDPRAFAHRREGYGLNILETGRGRQCRPSATSDHFGRCLPANLPCGSVDDVACRQGTRVCDERLVERGSALASHVLDEILTELPLKLAADLTPETEFLRCAVHDCIDLLR